MIGSSTALAIILSIGCGAAGKPVHEEFAAAEAAFEAAQSPADFRRSAAMYQEILDSGFVSGAVLYNQGNAYYRAGDRGRAVACYRQAQRLRPRDAMLEANLAMALGPEAASTGAAASDSLFFWDGWLGTTEKLLLMAASTSAAFLLGAAALWFRGRRRLRQGAILAATAAVLAAAAAGLDVARWKSCSHGVTVSADVVARKGSADGYDPAFTRPLAEGVEFRVRDRRPGWLLVRLPDGLEGWIHDADAVVY